MENNRMFQNPASRERNGKTAGTQESTGGLTDRVETYLKEVVIRHPGMAIVTGLIIGASLAWFISRKR